MTKIEITQVRSGVGQLQNHRHTLRTLGLKKIGQKVVRDNTPEVQGMVRTVAHLVTVADAADSAVVTAAAAPASWVADTASPVTSVADAAAPAVPASSVEEV